MPRPINGKDNPSLSLIDSTDLFCASEFMVKEGTGRRETSPKKIAVRRAVDNCKCSREYIKSQKRKEVKKEKNESD